MLEISRIPDSGRSDRPDESGMMMSANKPEVIEHIDQIVDCFIRQGSVIVYLLTQAGRPFAAVDNPVCSSGCPFINDKADGVRADIDDADALFSHG
jgi:hypothetical protein